MRHFARHRLHVYQYAKADEAEEVGKSSSATRGAAAAGGTGGTGSRDIRRVLSQKDRVMISRDDIDNAFSQVSESASHLRVIEAENPLIAISL